MGSHSAYFSGNDVDRTLALGRLFNYPVLDRTGTLSNGLRCAVLHPIPKFDPDFSLSLEELMLRRARQLLDRNDGRRLHLLGLEGLTAQRWSLHSTASLQRRS